jgi:hypothetical protein
MGDASERSSVTDLKGQFPPEMAADDRELMRIWGEINNAWDDIERSLYVAFDSLLIDVPSHLTQAIFYSQRSHAARRDMVQELAKCALIGKPQTEKALQKVINKRVKARADDRHKLTHGTWGITVNLKDGSSGLSRIALEPNYFSRSNPAYPRERLVQVRDQMRDTARALREAIRPIEDEKRAELFITTNRWMSRLTQGAAKTTMPSGEPASEAATVSAHPVTEDPSGV